MAYILLRHPVYQTKVITKSCYLTYFGQSCNLRFPIRSLQRYITESKKPYLELTFEYDLPKKCTTKVESYENQKTKMHSTLKLEDPLNFTYYVLVSFPLNFCPVTQISHHTILIIRINCKDTREKSDLNSTCIKMKSSTCKVRACTPVKWLKLKGSSGFKVECISVF